MSRMDIEPKNSPGSAPSRGRFVTAQEEAYEHLKAQILSGEFPGGMRLNPEEIGAALGLSRTPIREALRRLDVEGLVTLQPNRGAVVTVLTLDEVRERFKIRTALEMLATAEAAGRISEDDLDDLRILMRRMDRAQADPRDWIARHEHFHDRLYEIASMPRLSAEIRRMRETVHPYLRIYIDVYHTAEMPGFEHQDLLAAVASRDPARAAEAMREHIECATAGVCEFLAARESASVGRSPALQS
jgi:DNA-binding GntR family transcriptional regulator